ncbi:hypothetical protein MANES_13G068625v8 [Manihot esculenta]|uniref:Uncharacterized protein n=1 Tax=Manihot esculenta TaxID=3983 RepID=A0ACB7GM68_MANES|nr:hypothetical protein MANES_13G068625v8 [Manihot esculenta]
MAENPDSAEMLMVIQQIQALHCKETREAALQSLVQRIASHPRAKLILIYAQIPKHLKPFLDIRNEEMHHESLRRSSLVVLEALVKVDDAKVIGFFLKYDMITSFLNCMEFGGALSRTTATFIVHRILLNKDVLSHCDQAGRFLDILRRLELMINKLAKDGSLAEDTRKQLLKQIILCYHRLSENPSAYAKLRNRLPKELRDSSFTDILHVNFKGFTFTVRV